LGFSELAIADFFQSFFSILSLIVMVNLLFKLVFTVYFADFESDFSFFPANSRLNESFAMRIFL